MLNLPAFRFYYRYPDGQKHPGITVPISLTSNGLAIDVNAKVDPGAEFCLFERSLGEDLGLDIESGFDSRLATLSGTVPVFGHVVVIETFGVRFESFVYFAAGYGPARNLLGRTGWLDHFRVAIVHYDRELFLSPYES